MVNQVLSAVGEVNQEHGKQINLCAFVDSAFDVGKAPLQLPLEEVNLYADGRWSGLRVAGPILWRVPLAPGHLFERTIGRLVHHCNGRPMLSFIATTLHLHELAAHLQRYISPRIEGIDAALLRLADTRVAAELPGCLSSAHWSALSRCATQWWIFDRCARLTPLIEARPSLQPAQDESDQLELSQYEIGLLLKAGLPDALVNTLSEQLPEFLPDRGGATLHALMKQVLACARRHAIESYPDQYALAVLAVTHGATILEHSDLEDLLVRRDWPTGQLAARLMELA